MFFCRLFRALSLQSVTARVPSIKFRKGGHDAAQAGHAAPSSAASSKKSAGQSGKTITLDELPTRFRRQPISETECEYINRGGPA